jgi:hypothetical protein
MLRREFIGLLAGAAASPFALAARKDGLGEEPCTRSVLFSQYRNNGFAAHRR